MNAWELENGQIEAMSKDEAEKAWKELRSWLDYGYSAGRSASTLMRNPELHKKVIDARYQVQKRLGRHVWQMTEEDARSWGIPKEAHDKAIRKAMARGESVFIKQEQKEWTNETNDDPKLESGQVESVPRGKRSESRRAEANQ
jgi:hypothetical protein